MSRVCFCFLVVCSVLACTSRDRGVPADPGEGDGGTLQPGDDAAVDASTTARIDGGRADASSLCPAAECNLITNDGCARGGCRYLSVDGVSEPTPICEGAGSRTVGQGCLVYNDCAPGLYCSPLSYACLPYCCGGSDASCVPGTFCLDIWDGVGLCEPDARCNPFTSADCSEGESCLVVRSDGATLCLERTANNAEGEPCEGLDCEVGTQCAVAEGATEATCLRHCRVGDQAGCDVGERCHDQELSRRPSLGMCEPVEDPCSGSPNTGACTNTADCAIYEGNTTGTVTAAIGCASDADPTACVVRETGLSTSCARCFTRLDSRGEFLACAGF